MKKLLLLLLCLVTFGYTNAKEVTDVITYSSLGLSKDNSNYTEYEIKNTNSGAEYKLNCGAQNNNIIINAKTGYIGTSKSPGIVKKVEVEIANTAKLSIYAGNSAYSSAPSGTALATNISSSYEFTSNYSYVAFQGSGSLQITKLSITWEVSEGGTTEPDPIEPDTPNQGGTVTDVINNTFTGVTGSNYSDWTKEGTSGAKYAGNTAGSYSSVQMRTTNNNSGIVTTISGGKATKITIAWNTNTSAGRTVDVYGKNTAYSSPSDLYNNSTQGTKIGSLTYSNGTELNISDEYEYIGIRSSSSALYLDNIEITWQQEGEDDPDDTRKDVTLSFPETEYNVVYGETFTAPTLSFDPEAATGTVTYSSSDTKVATVNESTGEVKVLLPGKTTITASFAGNDDYKAAKASYTLNVALEGIITVSEAIELIDKGYSDTAQVKGIVSQVDSYNSTYKSITYYISDNGSTENHLEVYGGLGLNGEGFKSVEDVEVGAQVVVEGELTLYNNSIPEFKQNSKLLEYTAPEIGDVLGDLKAFINDVRVDEEGTFEATFVYGTSITFKAQNAELIKITTDNDVVASIEGEELVWTPEICEEQIYTVTATKGEESKEILFSVAVTAPVIYELVTSLDQLGDEADCIITNAEGTYAISTNQADNNRTATLVTEYDGYLTPGSDVEIITIEKTSDGKYTLLANENIGYLYAADGTSDKSNLLKTQDDPGDFAYATITISEEGTSIKFEAAKRGRLLFNPNSGNNNPLFSCYSDNSTQKPVKIFKKTTESTEFKTPEAPEHNNPDDPNMIQNNILVNAKASHELWYKIDIVDVDGPNNLAPASLDDELTGFTKAVKDNKTVTEINTDGDNNVYTFHTQNILNDKIADPSVEDSSLDENQLLVLTVKSVNPLTQQVSAPTVISMASDGTTSGIASVVVDSANAPVEYFNLQGQKVNNPESGLYIVRQGNKVSKVIIR